MIIGYNWNRKVVLLPLHPGTGGFPTDPLPGYSRATDLRLMLRIFQMIHKVYMCSESGVFVSENHSRMTSKQMHTL